MDSTGATARTPRRRLPAFLTRRAQQNVDFPPVESPSVGSRTFDAVMAKKTPRHTYHMGSKLRGRGNAPLATAVAPPVSGGFLNPDDLIVDVEVGKQGEQSPLLATGKKSRQQASDAGARAIKVTLYAALNTIICVPLMISFAQIIFRDPVFQPYLNDLVKLVLMSGTFFLKDVDCCAGCLV